MKSITIILILCMFVGGASAGITYDAPTNLITLDDSVGAGDSWATAFDMEDVLTNCNTVVTKQGANAYDVSARVQFNDGVYFISEDEFVEVKPNPISPPWTWEALSGSHIRIGAYNATDKFCYKGSFWEIYVGDTTVPHSNYCKGETLIYDSMIKNNADDHNSAINFDPSGTTKIYDSYISGTSYMRTGDIDCRNVRWINNGGIYNLLIAAGYDYAWSGLTVINGTYDGGGLYMSSTMSSDVDLYNVAFLGCGRDVLFSSGCGYLLRLINSPTFLTADSPGSGKPGMKLCYTFNVLVTDKNNIPLSDATVTLKNNIGEEVFSVITGIDGKLPTDRIIVEKSYRHIDDGGIIDYNDHKLTIARLGYGVYETDITIDHKIDSDQVCLDDLSYSYDDITLIINSLKPLDKLVGSNIIRPMRRT